MSSNSGTAGFFLSTLAFFIISKKSEKLQKPKTWLQNIEADIFNKHIPEHFLFFISLFILLSSPFTLNGIFPGPEKRRRNCVRVKLKSSCTGTIITDPNIDEIQNFIINRYVIEILKSIS